MILREELLYKTKSNVEIKSEFFWKDNNQGKVDNAFNCIPNVGRTIPRIKQPLPS